jgi:hypothetical protein
MNFLIPCIFVCSSSYRYLKAQGCHFTRQHTDVFQVLRDEANGQGNANGRRRQIS